MRVIAGEYRGRVLKNPTDNKIRPTSDRLRETIFNILSPFINSDTKFLDLCAGTGAIGIEALSRKCGSVAFVDISRKACGLIEQNLDLLKIPESQTKIFNCTALQFLQKLNSKTYEIIYYDPPYQDDYKSVLDEVFSVKSVCMADNGIFLAEHHYKTILPDSIGVCRRWRIVKQGETRVSFYEKN